jgi:SAM-dependent methyltransferase
MTDFRSSLYERYVSDFKSSVLLSGPALRSYWRWCDGRVFPLIADVPRDSHVLEIGCGPGYLLEYLRSKGFSHVEGIDISAEQVALAVQRECHAKVADVFEELSRHDATLSLILAFDVVEHFSKEENLQLFGAMRRALRPGGLVVLQTPNGGALFGGQIIYGDLTHMTIFNPNSLSQLLRRTGFTDIVFRESAPVAKNLVGLARAIIWSVARSVANIVRIAETGAGQAVWTQNQLCRARRVE